MINTTDILNAKILIVDDLEANVQVLERMLNATGYSCVDSTRDPTAVCELHRKNCYDLILLDLLMPGMNGFAVLEGLKALDPDSYVPVLVITAQPDHKLGALKAGARDFISKPFDLIEVKARIRNMLEVRLLYQLLDKHNKLLEQKVQQRTAELRSSIERFHRFTELSADLYWEQDKSGRYTQVSGPALEMLGIRGKGSPSISDGADSPRWNEAERTELEALIASRRPFQDFLYSRTNVSGLQQYFQVSGEPVLDPAGHYAGYRGIGTDVTELLRRH
jgi:CheY-like chemotaxis protein